MSDKRLFAPLKEPTVVSIADKSAQLCYNGPV